MVRISKAEPPAHRHPGGSIDTRIFVYDLDHRIVGQYGAGGAADLKPEYIWTLSGVGSAGPTGGDDGTGGYTPLAVAVGVAGTSGITSEVQWVHANHLGTPILTTNAAGQSVTPYGYAAIGFPGQFANALLLPGAEHYYNRYRDYDPTTGRYIQADPIGLAGDENAYVYAGANPLVGVDPWGLKVTVVASDPAVAKALQRAYYELNKTKRGREITAFLEASCIDFQIRPIEKDAFYCPPGAGGKCKGKKPYTVYIDPNNLLMLPTKIGMVPTPVPVVLGHELGHAFGTKDDGPNQMNNVKQNENPVRDGLGVPRRTSYSVPEIKWVPK